MANIQSTQAFYALTLEQPSAPTAAVACNVIPGLRSGDQQILEACGQQLILYRVDESEDRSQRRLIQIASHGAFGIIRGLASFRIPGTATGKYT